MRILQPRSTAAGLALAALLGAVGLAAPSASQTLQVRLLRFSAVVDATVERSLRWPVDVAAGAGDEIAVADAWESRVVVFRRVGAGWSTVREVALPATPVALTHASGRYLVAVRGAAQLFAVAGGEATGGPQPVTLPEGVFPSRLAVASDGDLLVADARGGRVVKLRDGAITLSVAVEEAITALASDGVGGFWVGTGATGEIHRHDAAGQRLVSWRLPGDGPVPPWPAGIVSEPGGRLFALDRHAHRVVVLDATGGLVGVGGGGGREPGQLRLPGGMSRLAGGGLLIGDGGNGRVQLFDVIGAESR